MTKIKGQTALDRDDFSGYIDTGCGGLCIKSTDCPFDLCTLDRPRHLSAPVTDDRAVVDMLFDGKSLRETATHFGISIRTVHRAQQRVTDALSTEKRWARASEEQADEMEARSAE